MYKEINTRVENMKKGDRVNFFWANFPDGNVINGGCDILEISSNVAKPDKNWLEQEEWSNDQILEFEKLRKSNRLMLITLQTDYYDPSTVVMDKTMQITLHRESIGT